MHAESRTPCCLPHHGLIKFSDATGLQIECLRGSLWITLDCDSRDFVIEPGQSFVTDKHQLVIVHALEASELRVLPRRSATEGASRGSASTPAS